VPLGTTLILFFTQLGTAVFLTVGETIFLSQLFPQVQAINLVITKDDIIREGLTGLKGLVSKEQAHRLSDAYGESLDATFRVAGITAAIAVLMSFAIEWKNLKK
jgi:hypothetical protein